ncbi:hypothetical protein F5B22DRAFT_454792 [Xylaria bambusicola]|uniref:uncharacterized protein n=1 Tax=Xylaria bambusicola TaxID=326684 RepID=UPI0020087782|nr:uncharacterized protein F5B22DRAFT_454792 [Xylaria bambusicola]KAI0506285.1 hypothetical protein F5B22DRAFT_454792 [Xylaria bambusicola]
MSRFTNPSVFPSFYELPSTSDPSAPSDKTWYLLAQIKENMTITKPTLIVTDRKGVDFALLFEDSISLKGFRKGHVIFVPGARRTDREGEGKKAVVHVPVGQGADVKVIPGSLERVFELGVVLEGQEGMSQRCAACGKMEGAFMKCTGCSFTAYCGKDCQVKGWGEMDHKSNCKVLKVLRDISV